MQIVTHPQERESQERDAQSPRYSRRSFFRKAAGTATEVAIMATALNSPEKTADFAYHALLNRQPSIPAELRQPIVVPSTDQPIAVVGLGHSLEKGYGSPVSTTALLAQELQRKGIPSVAIEGAVPGSVSTQTPQQYKKVKDKIPTGALQYPQYWTGENDPFHHPAVAEALKQMSRDPRSLITRYPELKKDVLEQLAKDYSESLQQVIDESHAAGTTVKLPSPVYRANRIVHIGDNGKPDFSVSLEGDDLETRAKKLALADLGLAAADVMTREALKLQQRGAVINVENPTNALQRNNYRRTPDQHPDEQGYVSVAQDTAKLYKKGK